VIQSRLSRYTETLNVPVSFHELMTITMLLYVLSLTASLDLPSATDLKFTSVTDAVSAQKSVDFYADTELTYSE